MRNTAIACLLLVAAITCGCAEFKTYMKYRALDFADCFTVRAGLSVGLGVRAQVTNYLGASIGVSVEGKVGYFGRAPVKAEGIWLGMPLTQILSPIAGIGAAKGSMCFSGTKFGLVVFLGSLSCTDVRLYEEKSLPGGACLLFVRALEDDPYMEPPTPFLREKFFIEVGAALGVVGFDVGFNPVEFVDFLLGWFTVDMTGDDTKKKPAAEAVVRGE